MGTPLEITVFLLLLLKSLSLTSVILITRCLGVSLYDLVCKMGITMQPHGLFVKTAGFRAGAPPTLLLLCGIALCWRTPQRDSVPIRLCSPRPDAPSLSVCIRRLDIGQCMVWTSGVRSPSSPRIDVGNGHPTL